MRRRRHGEDDSLELLLDTICNMFGGVIFIAILMAILAGKSGVTSSAAAGGPSRASILAAEVQDMKELVRQSEETLAVATEDGAIEESLKTIEEKIAEAKRRLEELREAQAQLAEKGKDTSNVKGNAAGRLADLKEESRRLADFIEREVGARRSDARLPVKHRSNLIGFPVILRGNILYEVYSINSSNDQEYNSADVSWEKLKDATRIDPRVGRGGYPVDIEFSRSARWIATIGKLDPRKRAFDVGLYPDSFEAFHRFREAATRTGFSYNVTLFAPGMPVHLFPTDEFPVQ